MFIRKGQGQFLPVYSDKLRHNVLDNPPFWNESVSEARAFPMMGPQPHLDLWEANFSVSYLN